MSASENAVALLPDNQGAGAQGQLSVEEQLEDIRNQQGKLLALVTSVLDRLRDGEPAINGKELRGDYLTEQQIAEICGVHPRTVFEWRNEESLPFIKKRKKFVRIRRADLEDWLMDGRTVL